MAMNILFHVKFAGSIKINCLVCIVNYHPAFVEGTSNVRASSFNDHAVTDMHKRAISFFSE